MAGRDRRVYPADRREEKLPWMAAAGINPGVEGASRMFASVRRPYLAWILESFMETEKL